MHTLLGKNEKKDAAQLSVVKNGDLDHAIDIIIPTLLEEISGGMVQEEKESEDVKDKIMEMKKSKVNECFFMLSRIIDFEHSVIFDYFQNIYLCRFSILSIISKPCSNQRKLSQRKSSINVKRR